MATRTSRPSPIAWLVAPASVQTLSVTAMARALREMLE